jgi:exonuclease SbcC
MVLNKKEIIRANTKTSQELLSQLKEFQNFIFDESKIKTAEETIKRLKKERELLYKDNLDFSSKITSFNLKIEDNKFLESKMSKMDICPTCLQNVDPVYKANVVNKANSDNVQYKKEIEELEQKRMGIIQKTKDLDDLISQKEKEITDLKIFKAKQQSINEKKLKIEELKKTNLLLDRDIVLLEKHFETLNASFIEMSKFDNLFSIKQIELKESLKEERAAEIKVAELRKEIELFTIQIKELKEKIKNTENVKKQMNYLSELENWISKKYLPLVSLIERNVMIKLKSEFSNLFEEWFLMLVSDFFSVRLDEDFTPIIEQQDYELDYSYLSGGERTAIALAYRLALNQVINSMISKIKTRDLVILDEPTDGFSEQQLDKMRSVLEQLKVKQLIVVSHEQKIEGFVENVIKLKKEKGISGKT